MALMNFYTMHNENKKIVYRALLVIYKASVSLLFDTNKNECPLSCSSRRKATKKKILEGGDLKRVVKRVGFNMKL